MQVYLKKAVQVFYFVCRFSCFFAGFYVFLQVFMFWTLYKRRVIPGHTPPSSPAQLRTVSGLGWGSCAYSPSWSSEDCGTGSWNGAGWSLSWECASSGAGRNDGP